MIKEQTHVRTRYIKVTARTAAGRAPSRCGTYIRCVFSVVHGVAACPVLGVADRFGLVDLPQLGHVVGEGVVGIGGRQQGLDGQEHGANLQGGTPLVLEDVEADASESIDVGMIDFGDEAHLGRGHGVVLGEEQFQFEEAALEGGVFGAGDDDVEVPGVGLRGHGADARHRFLHQPLRLLDDAPRQRSHGESGSATTKADGERPGESGKRRSGARRPVTFVPSDT